MKIRIVLPLLALSLLAPAAPVRATADPCDPFRSAAGNRTSDVSDRSAGSGPLRVFAIQYKQLVDYVVDYEVFASKMDCLMRDYVVPHLDRTKVNLVVFNEDIGLATIATGSRGAAARTLASQPVPGNTPELYDATGVPSGAAAALGSVAAGYGKELAWIQNRFPGTDPRKAIIMAATDTFARGFSTVFSKLARTYGVYVVASNNQADFEFSTDPADVAAFMDPDLAPRYARGELTGVWVPATQGARAGKAWNKAITWGPDTVEAYEALDVADPSHPEYDPRSNQLFENAKTPLTQIEKDFLALDDGDMSESNTGPFTLPDPRVAGFKLGFAISLPAFMFGDIDENPCDEPTEWMRCLHARGVNTVIQPEANPGPWARYGADGGRFQSVTWGASTLRIVTDPTVPGFKYVICPHMVGNLVDITFDGQSAILERGRTGPGRSYAGAYQTTANDDHYAIYAGAKPEFVALAPWVTPDMPELGVAADRMRMHGIATEMMAGSRSPRQNGYLETAIFADLAV